MNRSVVLMGCMVVAAISTSVQAQCQSGGSRGGSPGGSAGASVGTMAGRSMGYGSSVQSSVNPWSSVQLPGQALAQQMAMQAYQKQQKDQARRTESLARRQYWAAQRREQKSQSVASPGNMLAANTRSLNSGNYSASMSLDMSPSKR